MLGQPLDDIARLVDLAALDRCVTTERATDRLDQRFRADEDEQPTNWPRILLPSTTEL
jgi:hypothetical protein